MYTLLINPVICGDNNNNTKRLYLPVDYYISLGDFENSVAKANDGHLEGSLGH